MICTEFEDRLFDEDCRTALLGSAPAPADVAEHTARCPECARRWAEAAADTQRLAARLVVAPPPALRQALYRAARPKTSGWGWGAEVDTEMLSWTIAGGAVGASLVGTMFASPQPPDWVGFCVGASVGFTLAVLRGSAGAWLAQWAAIRRTAALLVDRLAEVL